MYLTKEAMIKRVAVAVVAFVIVVVVVVVVVAVAAAAAAVVLHQHRQQQQQQIKNGWSHYASAYERHGDEKQETACDHLE